MQTKRMLSILILLCVNLLLLTHLILNRYGSTKAYSTIQALEQEKEKARQSFFQRLYVQQPPAGVQSVSTASSQPEDSSLDEEKVQQVLQYADILQKTGEALSKGTNCGGGMYGIPIFNEETLDLFWKQVESQKRGLSHYTQRLASFVERLDLSSLTPEEAELIRQYVEWHNRASSILYDTDVPIQEKVDVCKPICDNFNAVKKLINKAIDAKYGEALNKYREMLIHTSWIVFTQSSFHTVGTHHFSFNDRPYKVIVPEGFSLP